MIIKELSLNTPDLDRLYAFYKEVLSFKVLEKTEASFKLGVGHSTLIFRRNIKAKPYHVAFNMPSNQIVEAEDWLNNRVELFSYLGKTIIDFPNWNAQALYFYDPDYNIIEFIARKNLNYNNERPFNADALSEISEIGLPTTSIETIYKKVNSQLGLTIYDGNLEKFCAIGDEHGLFIVIDKYKKKWFITEDEAFSSDFTALIQSYEDIHEVSYMGGELSTTVVRE